MREVKPGDMDTSGRRVVQVGIVHSLPTLFFIKRVCAAILSLNSSRDSNKNLAAWESKLIRKNDTP